MTEIVSSPKDFVAVLNQHLPAALLKWTGVGGGGSGCMTNSSQQSGLFQSSGRLLYWWATVCSKMFQKGQQLMDGVFW